MGAAERNAKLREATPVGGLAGVGVVVVVGQDDEPRGLQAVCAGLAGDVVDVSESVTEGCLNKGVGVQLGAPEICELDSPNVLGLGTT